MSKWKTVMTNSIDFDAYYDKTSEEKEAHKRARVQQDIRNNNIIRNTNVMFGSIKDEKALLKEWTIHTKNIYEEKCLADAQLVQAYRDGILKSDELIKKAKKLENKQKKKEQKQDDR